MKRVYCLITAFGLGFGPAAWAQGPALSQPSGKLEPLPPVAAASTLPAGGGPTSLADFEQAALTNNPTLAKAGALIQAAQGAWLQEGLYPNPVLSYVGDELGNNGTAGFQGAKISQEIVTGGKRRLSQAAASQEVAAAQQRFAAQEFRVRNDVRMRFYDALVAQRTVEISDQLVRVGDEGVRASDSLYRAQTVSRVDVLQARVEADTAQIQREKARNAYLSAWRRLTAVAGLPRLEPRPIAGDLQEAVPQLEWDASLQHLLSCSPEMAAASARANAARFALERAGVEAYPNLNVEVGAQHANESGDNVVNIMAGIPVPLFNRNQGNIRKAEGELAAAQAEMNRVALDLQNRLATAFERYANAREQTQRYQQNILPNAKSSLDLVTSGYREGEFDYVAVLTAQRTYFQTNLALADALRELRQSAVLIEGMLLSDSLSSGEGGDAGSSGRSLGGSGGGM